MNKKVILISAIVIIFIIPIVIISLKIKNVSYNEYQNMENNMIKKAKEFVTNNNIDSNMYLSRDMIGASLDNSCYDISGVIYENEKFTPYLVCDNYVSNINVESNGIELLGPSIMIMSSNDMFIDPGYISDNDIIISGSVGSDSGIYNINYIDSSSNSLVTRKVIVFDDDIVNDYLPKISINGDEIINITVGNSYEELGVTVTDKFDNDINNSVQILGKVDTSAIGKYRINYIVFNSKGFTSVAMREINVTNESLVDNSYLLVPKEQTSDNVTIILSIKINNFDYVILPNEEIVYDNYISYEVSQNGIYSFIVNNRDGESFIQDIEVNNINKTKPIATCKADLYNDRTEIMVDSDNIKNISKFIYRINNIDEARTSSIYISHLKDVKDVKVLVYDNLGNTNEVLCKMSDNRKKMDDNGITTIITGLPLQIPIADALARRGYTINDLNSCIANRVRDDGPGTRYGVAQAAYSLIYCTKQMTGYRLSYDHEGGKVEGGNYATFNSDIYGKLGVNSRWGKVGGSSSEEVPHYGLNCATFVRWSFCNGGMDMCTKGSAGAGGQSSTKYYPEANIVVIYKNKAKYKAGEDLTLKYSAREIINMIKPGDVIHSIREDGASETEHTTVVVGRNDKGIYIAENGKQTRLITYNNLLNGDYYYRILLLDNYYANPNNRNTLYD